MRKSLALPLPGTVIAIRGVVSAVMASAHEAFDRDITCAGTTCACREEMILICGALKLVDLSGGDEDTEVKTWKEDFKRYLEGLS